MALKFAERGQVPSFIVMDVLRDAAERQAAGENILHLEVGQPSTGLPDGARLALKERMAAGDPMGYTVAKGLPELRNAIADHYARTTGQSVDPDRIMATTGSSGGFVLAFLAAFEAGDRVGLAMPGYPAYRHILTALGIEPVLIPTDADSRFQPTVGHLEEVARRDGKPLDGLILAAPSNPGGTILSSDDMAVLYAHCRAVGTRLISDEIYHGLTYDGHVAPTALACGDDAIIVNSFSKYFCMTGWRLGWLVLPPDMIRGVECLAQNLFIAPPAISQHAGALVFDHQQVLQENLERYGCNRRVLLDALPKAGFGGFAPPDGAFYIYTDISALLARVYGQSASNDNPETNSLAFCAKLLAETGVALTPGLDFDPQRGGSFVRFSFCGAEADIRDAADRLVQWSEGLG